MLKSIGVVRGIDDVGRLVIPKGVRKGMDIKPGDAFEIFIDGDYESIVLKKYNPADIFTGEMEDLIEYHGKRVSKSTIKELARIAGLQITE